MLGLNIYYSLNQINDRALNNQCQCQVVKQYLYLGTKDSDESRKSIEEVKSLEEQQKGSKKYGEIVISH